MHICLHLCCSLLHYLASLPYTSLRIYATPISIITHLYCLFNQQPTSTFPSSSVVLIDLCLCLCHIYHIISLLLLSLFSHLIDTNVFIVPPLYHFFPCCPNSLTTSPLCQIYFTTIIICIHQRASLPPTSLYQISPIAIIILCHITTYPLIPQSYCLSSASAASILLNHHIVPPPPPSLSRISTTSVIIVMCHHRRIHCPTTLIDIDK